MSLETHTREVVKMTEEKDADIFELRKRGLILDLKLDLYAMDSGYSVAEAEKILALVESKLVNFKL